MDSSDKTCQILKWNTYTVQGKTRQNKMFKDVNLDREQKKGKIDCRINNKK